jgi:hypothetical protein
LSLFGHPTFYFSLIRKYVIVFGTIFKDLHIKRFNSSGDLEAIIKVPIAYSPLDKMMARMQADASLDRESAITLPRMAFEITNYSYDGDRAFQTLNRVVVKHPTNPNKALYQYESVPYNFDISLNIMVKNAEDGVKIIEQILPFFRPEWTITAELIEQTGQLIDLPVVMRGQPTVVDTYDDQTFERRVMVWNIPFTIKGFVYGPVREKPIIKVVKQQFKLNAPGAELEDSVGNTDINIVGRITTTPGLTANGEPTSNSAASIDYNLIEVDDDYGFIIDFEGDQIIEED